MADVSKIPTKEMVDDYYASLMDAKTCDRLGLEERAEKNRRIMEVIQGELERRGELARIGKGGSDGNKSRVRGAEQGD